MTDTEWPSRALHRLLQVDRAFGTDPRRLRRGLLDLLPADDRAVGLLTVGAELGVPGLIEEAGPAAAVRHLVERAGMRADVAEWVVATWRAGCAGSAAEAAAQQVARSRTVRLAALPDDTLLVVGRGDAGIFGAVVDVHRPEPPPQWHQLAGPATGESRDVAVTVDGAVATVLWADAGGAYVGDLRWQGTTLTADPPRCVVPDHDGLTVGDPICVLAIDDSLHNVIWSPDRRELRRSVWRAWPTDDPDDHLPPCCAAGEEVTRVDAARIGDDLAWLVARTSRGRILVSRWDLARDDIASWVPSTAPGDAVDVAATGSRVVAVTAAGEFWTVELGAVFARQEGAARLFTRSDASVRALAAATTREGSWLAAVFPDACLLTSLEPGGPLTDRPLSLWAA